MVELINHTNGGGSLKTNLGADSVSELELEPRPEVIEGSGVDTGYTLCVPEIREYTKCRIHDQSWALVIHSVYDFGGPLFGLIIIHFMFPQSSNVNINIPFFTILQVELDNGNGNLQS